MHFRSLVPALPLAALAALASAPAQAQSGEQVFAQRCKSCHAVTPEGKAILGPTLHGVVGRKAASTGFRYSPALTKSGVTWTRESLDKYLANPMQTVPGTRMVVKVTDAAQRKALIDFLSTKR